MHQHQKGLENKFSLIKAQTRLVLENFQNRQHFRCVDQTGYILTGKIIRLKQKTKQQKIKQMKPQKLNKLCGFKFILIFFNFSIDN